MSGEVPRVSALVHAASLLSVLNQPRGRAPRRFSSGEQDAANRKSTLEILAMNEMPAAVS